MLKKSTRQAMERKIYSVFDKMDPSGKNTKHYKELLGSLDDKKFEKFMVDMFNDPNIFLCLEMAAYENEPTDEGIEAAANELGIELYEYVAFPHMSTDPNHPFVTPEKVPVGYIHIKRLQQMKRKKNSTSTDINHRDGKTGQVTGDAKNARNSDMEAFAMSTYGATEALKEFMGPRADNMRAKNEFYADIAKNGYADLSRLTDDPSDRKALNTLNSYLICMGLLSDLVSPGYVLKSTLDEK